MYYSFLVVHATLTSGNLLHFRKNPLERMQKQPLTINHKIRGEKLQHDINKEVSKISALLSGKSDKYDCLRGE